MATREHSFRKKQCVGSGIVDIDLSFESGAALDGTFPSATLVDGYLDAYGAGLGADTNSGLLKVLHRGNGVHGVLYQGTGQYQIILDRVYIGCMSFGANLCLVAIADRTIQFRAPVIESLTGADGKTRSICEVVILNGSGAKVDLATGDRVAVRLSLKNSMA